MVEPIVEKLLSQASDRDDLNNHEQAFVDNLVKRRENEGQEFELTERQFEWLESIAERDEKHNKR